MCLAQGPQRSDAGEAGTRGPKVSSQALSHCTPIFMNKNIRNNIILKTEQNASQAHHIKRQNQNLEGKHCRFICDGSL